jgi:hypothetical protein
MFVGHAAVALAARSRTPSISLGWLFAATFGLDLLWPVFLLLGVERVTIAPGATPFSPLIFDSYPWSHSLAMALVWSAATFALARALHCSAGQAAILGGLVFSHWVLDYITHVPDLPLWPGHSPHVGLGLWQSVAGTLLIEGAMYIAGICLYFRATRPRDRIGALALGPLLLLCAAMWASGPIAAPPPNARVLAWFTLGLWLFVAWAGWADSHRTARR